jgi:hypothetical protein
VPINEFLEMPLIDVQESVMGMKGCIENFDMADTGCFKRYDGRALPW